MAGSIITHNWLQLWRQATACSIVGVGRAGTIGKGLAWRGGLHIMYVHATVVPTGSCMLGSVCVGTPPTRTMLTPGLHHAHECMP